MKKKKVLCALIICMLLLIATSAHILNRNATMRPGNPLPYFVGMARLSSGNPFARVSENIYIVRSDRGGGDLFDHIKTTHAVEFTEQMGTCQMFSSTEIHITTCRDIYFGFNVYKLSITQRQ